MDLPRAPLALFALILAFFACEPAEEPVYACFDYTGGVCAELVEGESADFEVACAGAGGDLERTGCGGGWATACAVVDAEARQAFFFSDAWTLDATAAVCDDL